MVAVRGRWLKEVKMYPRGRGVKVAEQTPPASTHIHSAPSDGGREEWWVWEVRTTPGLYSTARYHCQQQLLGYYPAFPLIQRINEGILTEWGKTSWLCTHMHSKRGLRGVGGDRNNNGTRHNTTMMMMTRVITVAMFSQPCTERMGVRGNPASFPPPTAATGVKQRACTQQP